MHLGTLRVVFMGTPDFAVPALRSLVESGVQLVGVFCQPARPAQRGHKIQKCAIQLEAEQLGLKVFTPQRLSDEGVWEAYQELAPDITIVAAYGALLSERYLHLPRLGCINIHASLLPRWRGASPIQSAICAGDDQSGITIMNMVKKLDAGGILAQRSCEITPHTNAQSLHDDLAQMGGVLLVDVLPQLAAGTLSAREQDESLVTYAPKLVKADGFLQWTKSAHVLEREVRGYFPWPCSWFSYKGELLKVLKARVVEGSGYPGEVLDDSLRVACGEKALVLEMLQREGRKPLAQAEFLKGFRIPAGTRLDHAL